jgi:hypothetical protein
MTEPREAFLRVLGASYYGVAGVVRWVNIRCFCCDPCFRQGRSISKLRLWIVLLVGIVPGGLLLAMGGILGQGTTTRAAGHALLFAGAALFFLGFFLFMPLLLHFVTRRRIQAFLDPEVEEKLFELGGFQQWGIFRHIALLKKLPKKENALLWEDVEQL